ncbi:flagellar protein FlaG [Clostridium sp. OS1-26]|uniref:flagellar protein FlaG n=1 Tax=Clostridium sp. OS1-26 TaxID=3070681 RepID=UPI0027DEE417|nr:flagellar protein FlaG [Clostridium sp. OS1-26]WML35503.1 flagellar protein FlaG [Clostridium sp. OS1-26]
MEVKNLGQGRQINEVDFLQQNEYVNLNPSTKNIESSEGIGVQDKNISEEEVKKSVDKFNKLMEDKSTYVEYEVYGKFKDITIRIVNSKTKEVIREIPPKKIIDMIDKLCELAGVFVDQKA